MRQPGETFVDCPLQRFGDRYNVYNVYTNKFHAPLDPCERGCGLGCGRETSTAAVLSSLSTWCLACRARVHTWNCIVLPIQYTPDPGSARGSLPIATCSLFFRASRSPLLHELSSWHIIATLAARRQPVPPPTASSSRLSQPSADRCRRPGRRPGRDRARTPSMLLLLRVRAHSA